MRGEGCGVVVLKRLREAEADGDPIWGVIHGAAVNHGGASVGLTVPHEPALVRVMNEALSDAGVSPAEVDYIEAHGTGTTVGDPIEINAVAAAYASEREAEHPLLVGSVKTNLGHLESAAGIAGLIKAVLVVQQGVIRSTSISGIQPEPRLGAAADPRDLGDDGLAAPQRPAPSRRGELLRDLGDELAPDRRGIPGWGPAAPEPPAGGIDPAGHRR